jgi:hypothetical protein
MWIVGQFSAIFVGMFNAALLFALRFLTWRLAVVSAWVGLIALGITALLNLFDIWFDKLIGAIPGVEIISMFAPSSLTFCFSIIFASHSLHAGYILAARIAAYKATIFTA